MVRSTLWLSVVCGILVCLTLPLSAETILDDHFDGTTLDTNIWESSYWATGPVFVSESRLTLGSLAGIEAYNTYSLNYVNMHLFGVEGTRFGFGLSGALGGFVELYVADTHQTALYLRWAHVETPFAPPSVGDEQIDLGLSSDGDFQIIWTPTLFQVINNGEVLFSRDDPAQIPYYEPMGPFSLWTLDDGSLSLDRVVLTIPEPATLSMLSLSLFLLRFSYRRRKP